MKKTFLEVGVAFFILFPSASALARDLKEILESTLFGGNSPSVFTIPDLRTGRDRPLLSANPVSFGRPLLAMGSLGSAVTQAFGNEIISESAVVPVPSGSSGFAYEFNPDLNVFERQTIGLGAIFNERVNTLGQGRLAFGVAYIRQDFDEYEGEDISSLRIRRGLFARPPLLGLLVDSGDVEATLNLDITTNTAAIWAIYGITEWLDASFLLPVTEIKLRARSTVRQVRDALSRDIPAFLSDSLCTVDRALAGRCRISDFLLIRQGTRFTITDPRTGEETGAFSDLVDESRAGVGDLILRTKASFFESPWGALGGLVEFTFPTGDEDDFLGDDAFKARFLLLYSYSLFNRLYFHLNGGGRVTSQTSRKNTLEYGSAMDLMVTERLSLIAELTGSWRVDPEGLPSHFIDGAFGFKANLLRGLILAVTFRIPATDDGLRSDVAYLAGLEYDF